MTRLSRRAVLQRISLAGGAIAAASVGAWRLIRRKAGPPPTPPPVGEGAGPPSPATLATLLWFVEAVIGLPIDRAHYETFLRWRCEHLPGYRAMCDALAGALEQAAVARGQPSFAAAAPALQRSLADEISASKAPALAGVATLRRELLTLFAHTDAWVLSGYDGWPGVPRGFDAYRRAPARRPGP